MTTSRVIASWFGSGLLPWAPGTWGSLAALPFAWAILFFAGELWLLVAAIVVFIVGCVAADRASRGGDDPDPGWIVIDEVAGQWLTLLVLPLSFVGFAIGFALFRLFDIWKPWPVRWIERRCGGGFGIMIDDIAAAAYAMLVVMIGRFVLER